MPRRTETDNSGSKSANSGGRAERLKAALRENLRRRKAQERARKLGPAAAETGSTGPSERDKR